MVWIRANNSGPDLFPNLTPWQIWTRSAASELNSIRAVGSLTRARQRPQPDMGLKCIKAYLIIGGHKIRLRTNKCWTMSLVLCLTGWAFPFNDLGLGCSRSSPGLLIQTSLLRSRIQFMWPQDVESILSTHRRWAHMVVKWGGDFNSRDYSVGSRTAHYLTKLCFSYGWRIYLN